MPERRLRLHDAAAPAKHRPEIAVCVGIGRLDANGMTELLLSLHIAAQSAECGTKIVAGRSAGRLLQHLTIAVHGFGVSLRGKKLIRPREQGLAAAPLRCRA